MQIAQAYPLNELPEKQRSIGLLNYAILKGLISTSITYLIIGEYKECQLV